MHAPRRITQMSAVVAAVSMLVAGSQLFGPTQAINVEVAPTTEAVASVLVRSLADIDTGTRLIADKGTYRPVFALFGTDAESESDEAMQEALKEIEEDLIEVDDEVVEEATVETIINGEVVETPIADLDELYGSRDLGIDAQSITRMMVIDPDEA
jgi:hypothetical protein